jgi:short-subunit dehydrogenase
MRKMLAVVNLALTASLVVMTLLTLFLAFTRNDRTYNDAEVWPNSSSSTFASTLKALDCCGVLIYILWSAVAVALFHFYAIVAPGKIDLRNRRVWVTGASSGIGEAIATSAYQAGADVVLSARSTDKLNALKERIESLPVRQIALYPHIDLVIPVASLRVAMLACTLVYASAYGFLTPAKVTLYLLAALPLVHIACTTFDNSGKATTFEDKAEEMAASVWRKPVCIVHPVDVGDTDALPLHAAAVHAALNDALKQQYESLTKEVQAGATSPFSVFKDKAVDLLVLNAGISTRSVAEDQPVALDERLMRINFFGAVALCKAMLPYMRLGSGFVKAAETKAKAKAKGKGKEKEKGDKSAEETDAASNGRARGGNIVVMSSVQGVLSVPYRAPYAASKHAVHGWFNALRHEVDQSLPLPSGHHTAAAGDAAPANVGVTLVCPGYVQTNIGANAIKSDAAASASSTKLSADSAKAAADTTNAAGWTPQRTADATLVASFLHLHEVWLCDARTKFGAFAQMLAPGLLYNLLHRKASVYGKIK